MDSEDSRDGGGDGSSSSSSSGSSSKSRSRRSSSSEGSDRSAGKRKTPRSPVLKDGQDGPKSPSRTSDGNLSDAHSNINSPENSQPLSPSPSRGPASPPPPKSPSSDEGSKNTSPERYTGPRSPPLSPKSPLSPRSRQSVKSPLSPKSPQSHKSLQSPTSQVRSTPASPEELRSRPASPDSRSHPASPDSQSHPGARSPPGSPASPAPATPGETSQGNSTQSSPLRTSKKDWSPKPEWGQRKSGAGSKRGSRDRSGSESSRSSRDSSYNKRSTVKDPATEEISEGEMESDHEDDKPQIKSNMSVKREVKEDKHMNMTHEDLSDVSDLDSVGAFDDVEKPKEPKSRTTSPERQPKLNGNDQLTSPSRDNESKLSDQKLEKTSPEKPSKPEDGEEQLDFEAEEGECVETAPVPKEQDKPERQSNGEVNVDKEKDDDAKSVKSNASSLEEGEVSDEGERRPEESEPRPVCRFYSRGQCTWGISCRFLHPGVTDKGNYSMFEVVRGVPTHAPPVAYALRDPAPPESAWERGLRTAKEMLRQANKRKEQDMDFEEKKLHLSVGGAVHDPDAELAYAAAAVGASPPHSHHDAAVHSVHLPLHRELPPDIYRGYGPPFRRPYIPGRPIDERERYERVAFDRSPYERPAYDRLHYEEHKARYEDTKPRFDDRLAPQEDSAHKRRGRTSREVIVQRAPTREGRGERAAAGGDRGAGAERGERGGERGEKGERGPGGDDWADPWMRDAARRRRPPSSGSSYSTSSSSRSSSRSSRSPGSRREKKRAKSPTRQRLSPTAVVRERRLATARATAMNPPAPRRRAPSPAAVRQHSANPPAPTAPAPPSRKEGVDLASRSKPPGRGGDRTRKRYSSSSGSESSSSSSGSESDSRSTSSSGSSSDARRARTVRALNAANRPRVPGKQAGVGPGTMAAAANKKDVAADHKVDNTTAKKRAAPSPPADVVPPKKSVSRREELLKQLKAVEDAIARKRSKI